MSAQAFVDLLSAGPAACLVANLETRVICIGAGPHRLPCTINDGAPTCYICCPTRVYVSYARAEWVALPQSRLLSPVVAPLLKIGGVLIALAGLDRQVQPNNWLFSTNPAPRIDAAALDAMVAGLIADHPGHVVYWRSLDEYSSHGLQARLSAAGWVLLPARLVYLFDCRGTPPKIGRNEARDRLALEHAPYDVVDGARFDAADFERAAWLYRLLYLEKYTPLNPHYTAAFLAGLAHAGLLDLKGLRSPEGRLDGIIGFFDQDDVMTAPIVGYDTARPQHVGLYRMLMALGFQRARARRLLFNISAGADDFKRNRGAVPALEYSAVYNRHLPIYRRAALRLFAALLTKVAVPILERSRAVEAGPR